MSTNPSLSCNQQRAASGIQNPAAAAAALEAAAWFGPNSSFSGQLPIVDLAADDVTVAEDDEGDEEDDDAVQHLASFSTHNNPTATNPVHVKQEQLFGEWLPSYKDYNFYWRLKLSNISFVMSRFEWKWR